MRFLKGSVENIANCIWQCLKPCLLHTLCLSCYLRILCSFFIQNFRQCLRVYARISTSVFWGILQFVANAKDKWSKLRETKRNIDFRLLDSLSGLSTVYRFAWNHKLCTYLHHSPFVFQIWTLFLTLNTLNDSKKLKSLISLHSMYMMANDDDVAISVIFD